MDLPRRDEAAIPPKKITEYLLSESHPEGGPKAAFFRLRGFSADRPQELADALLRQARTHPVARIDPSPMGLRYIIEAPLECPDGRSPLVRSVWFIENGEEIPRLASAYPIRRRRR